MDYKRTQMPVQTTIPRKLSVVIKGERKVFHNKNGSKEFKTSNPALERILRILRRQHQIHKKDTENKSVILIQLIKRPIENITENGGINTLVSVLYRNRTGRINLHIVRKEIYQSSL